MEVEVGLLEEAAPKEMAVAGVPEPMWALGEPPLERPAPTEQPPQGDLEELQAPEGREEMEETWRLLASMGVLEQTFLLPLWGAWVGQQVKR